MRAKASIKATFTVAVPACASKVSPNVIWAFMIEFRALAVAAAGSRRFVLTAPAHRLGSNQTSPIVNPVQGPVLKTRAADLLQRLAKFASSVVTPLAVRSERCSRLADIAEVWAPAAVPIIGCLTPAAVPPTAFKMRKHD